MESYHQAFSRGWFLENTHLFWQSSSFFLVTKDSYKGAFQHWSCPWIRTYSLLKIRNPRFSTYFLNTQPSTHAQYISRLKVSMYNSLLHQIAHPWQDLVHDLNGVILAKFLFLADVLMQVAMRTIFQNNIVKIWGFDDFEQPDYVFVYQTFVDLNFSLKHLQVGASELFKLNYFNGVTLVFIFDFNCFVNFTWKALSQLVISGIFINTHFGLVLLESVQLLQALLLGEVSGQWLVFVVAALDFSAKSSHTHSYS